ncbi:unnamed protein product [Rhizoctonia solani]|uniref:O-methylsterigmatocystin oxidoreductase n=1 Tax=Rhizoctonia solani TaxID=456999 RepID=A0A8H3H6M2_9AGAM|nr:unnamed protein product [Rhizoctonia solani]
MDISTAQRFSTMLKEHYPAVCLTSISGFALWWLLKKRKEGALPLPPSPKSDPLIGHLRFLPSVDEHIAYKKWGDELQSDIISLNMMGQVIIVLNSAEAANELLVRRAAIYSDRPQLPMVRDESLMAACTILSTAYGYETTASKDELVEIVETANKGLCQAALPGNFFVNVVPWLRCVPSWLPGAGWKRQAHKWRAEKDKMLYKPFNWTREQMAAGTAAPSMLKNLLSNLASQDQEILDGAEEEDRIRWTTGTMFSAGSDTSVAVLLVFVLAMTLHPEAQRKAQLELDSVLTEHRLPELTDRPHLPYVNRLIKEVLRWRTVAPLAIPHKCTEDDHYKGYHIPKGAMVIGNVWAMSNDSKTYSEPGVFNPDRFLDPLVPDAPLFGFGRRSCLGIHLAEAVLFSTISTMLTVFQIRPICDSLGNPLLPSATMGPNMLVNHPSPFDCKIVVRSEKYERLLREWSTW